MGREWDGGPHPDPQSSPTVPVGQGSSPDLSGRRNQTYISCDDACGRGRTHIRSWTCDINHLKRYGASRWARAHHHYKT